MASAWRWSRRCSSPARIPTSWSRTRAIAPPSCGLCRIAARRLGAADLARYLVIVAPAAALDDLPEALFEGLHRDLDRCLSELRGLAALVDPTMLPPTPLRGTP